MNTQTQVNLFVTRLVRELTKPSNLSQNHDPRALALAYAQVFSGSRQ